MVVDIIDIKGVRFGKTEDDPPICANSDRPQARQFAFERVQAEAGDIHIDRDASCLQPCENITQLLDVLGG